MKKEHAVSVSLTNGTECICNPDIVLGDKYGLWDLDNEISPIGTLLDLNAAWELFISRKKFENISYKVTENSEGDKTYTLVDDNGNPTKAIFTIKNADEQIVDIQWLDGKLYIFYNRKRPINSKEELGLVPVKPVLDELGNPVYDEETGKPLVYDNVVIPAIEIFDNHETHKLFPWFADDLHTVRLRQSVDNNDNNHLGDFVITRESEVFFAEQRYIPSLGNTLISLLSLNDQLQKTLGVGYMMVKDASIIDIEGQNTYYRIVSDTLPIALNTEKKTSITAAINGIQTTNDIAEDLAFGLYYGIDSDVPGAPFWKAYIDTTTENDYIDYHLIRTMPNLQDSNSHRYSLLGAINTLLEEIGDPAYFPTPFNGLGGGTILDNLSTLNTNVNNARNRIGWNNNNWITLTTEHKNNLSEAINELDELFDNLNIILGLEDFGNQYDNPDIHQIIKDRTQKGNDVTIVEAINDLQNLLGDLRLLSTTNKNNVIEAINEHDSEIGVLNNLTTDVKTSLVGAINELDTHIDSNSQNIGNLSELNTTDKSDLVSAVNETLTDISLVSDENPFEVYKVGTSKLGVLVKGKNNSAKTDSLVAGRSNSAGVGSFVFGYSNNALSGEYSIVGGEFNHNDGSAGIIIGNHNNIILSSDGDEEGSIIHIQPYKNQIFGSNNTITNALENFISGTSNNITGGVIKQGNSYAGYGLNNKILGNGNTVNKGNNIFILGNSNTLYKDPKDVMHELENNYVFGYNNTISGQENYIIGHDAVVSGSYNYIFNPTGFSSFSLSGTYIGGDVYIVQNGTLKLQEVTFIDFNKYASGHSITLNSLSALLEAVCQYVNEIKGNGAIHTIAKFNLTNRTLGYVIIQDASARVYYNNTWYYCNNPSSLNQVWVRKEGEYLQVVQKEEAGVTKNYLVIKDHNTSGANVLIGQQSGNTIAGIDLTSAYGAINLDDIWDAFDLTTKLNNKVNTSSVLTTVKDVNGTPTNITQPISSVTLDLIDSFGFDKSLYQLRSEKGQANGYAPLDANGKVPATNLPSYVDDVVDVWAEYDISETGELSNIHLYEYNSGTKGSEILSGESDKVYVQANGTIARLFRWSGSVWSSIGPAQLVLGEIQGTAYDGLKGKTTTDSLISHINNTNNPHNVQASQLNVAINDPNDPNNLLGTSPYNVNYNVLTALQKLFDRVNISEDDLSSLTTLIGSVSEIELLAGTSVIGAILDFTPMTNSEITTSVNTYFKFYGEN